MGIDSDSQAASPPAVDVSSSSSSSSFFSVGAIFATVGHGLRSFLKYYIGAILMFYFFSLFDEYGNFPARVLVAYLGLAVCSGYGVVASIALRLSGGDRWQSAQWTTGRAYKYVMRYFADFEFVIDDPKDILGTTRPAIFVGNHQTAMDVLMLGTMFPRYCSVTAKRSLRSYPILGWFMSLSGTIFIDRTNRQDARAAMRSAAEAVTTLRQSVFMFPEGTRSGAQEPTLLPFKKGAFHLAVQAGAPIVPVVVANYSHLYSTLRFRFLPGRVPIKVLDPIPTTGLTTDDVGALTEKVHELMLKELVDLTARARAEPRYDVNKAQATPVAVPAAPSTDTAVASGVDAAL